MWPFPAISAIFLLLCILLAFYRVIICKDKNVVNEFRLTNTKFYTFISKFIIIGFILFLVLDVTDHILPAFPVIIANYSVNGAACFNDGVCNSTWRPIFNFIEAYHKIVPTAAFVIFYITLFTGCFSSISYNLQLLIAYDKNKK